MCSRKMFQSSKRRVLEKTWERCCDLARKAWRRSLHRDQTCVLARDVQKFAPCQATANGKGAKATPNRAKRAPGCTSENKMTSSIAREFPMFRNISERGENVGVHKREKIRVPKRPPCQMGVPQNHGFPYISIAKSRKSSNDFDKGPRGTPMTWRKATSNMFPY